MLKIEAEMGELFTKETLQSSAKWLDTMSVI